MAEVVAIEQDYDIVVRYGQAFRLALVYSHHSLQGNPPKHRLIRCFNNNAMPQFIYPAVQQVGVRFITGMGHGSYDRFTGQHGVTIWQASAIPPSHVTDKLVHLCSCETGAMLGLEMVKQGATVFWGYTVSFVFYHSDPPPISLESDPVARIFFQMDAIVDRGILAGRDATTIYDRIVAYFWQVYPHLSSG